jgi:(p)ppGpp synthase/HD superfamily hydrolase
VELSYEDVDALAAAAHAGQVDRVGVPYVAHVRAVAAALRPLGEELAMAGLLHDVLEDTSWTADGLLEGGVPAAVVATVQAVTKVPGLPYAEMVRRVAADPAAALVKIADNAHNSHPDRAAALAPAERERLAAKYAAARAVLWPAVDPAHLRVVVGGVNPALLEG